METSSLKKGYLSRSMNEIKNLERKRLVQWPWCLLDFTSFRNSKKANTIRAESANGGMVIR